MSERRVFVRQANGQYAMLGLVGDVELVQDIVDESTGERFVLAHTTDRYIVYAPAIIEMPPDPDVPDAWKPFVAHGLHDHRQPTPGV